MQITGNTGNTIVFDKITAGNIRLSFNHPHKQMAIVELDTINKIYQNKND